MNIFSIIELAGAFHGFVLTIILFTRKQNRSANRILASAICILSFLLLDAAHRKTGFYTEIPRFIFIMRPMYFLIYPLFYFYILDLTSYMTRFKPIYLLHFLPFVIDMILVLPFLFRSDAFLVDYYESMLKNGATQSFMISFSARGIQSWAYAVASLFVLRRYSSRIKEYFSEIDKLNLKWLKTFIIFFLFALLSGSLKLFSRLLDVEPPEIVGDLGSFALTAGSSLWIYVVGYFALLQPEIRMLTSRMEKTLENNDVLNIPVASMEINGSEEDDNKYVNCKLNIDYAEQLSEELKLLVKTEYLYRDSSLTLQDLAERLNVSAHTLSQTINIYMRMNFYTFINKYRVEEVLRLFKKDISQKKSITQIATESGFKSKSTFNNMFKKVTGKTPSVVRKELGAEKRTEVSPLSL